MQLTAQLPEEILKKVKLLEISTRRLVNNLFAGEYHTVFKGQGMTFAEFREYVPGDDVRAISWTLTARTGKPFIKKFDEERELSLVLAIDVSASGDFGSKDYLKGEVMAYLAALLAFSAQKNKDQVGLLLFSDQVEHFVPPGKGRGHIQRILRDILYYKPKSRRTKISVALQHLASIMKKKSVIFVISDFIDEGFDESLRFLGQKHEVVALIVEDQAEINIPDVGVVDLQDPETGEVFTVDTSSSEFRKIWQQERKSLNEKRDRLLRQSQVDRVLINSSENYADQLVAYFKTKKLRR